MPTRSSPSRSPGNAPDKQPSDAHVVALPLAPLEDDELLRQLVEGRPAAFRELFDRYARVVRGALIRMLGSEAEIDDLTQDALMIVVRRAASVRDGGALRSFVYSVAIRVARNELRRRALRRFVPWESIEDVGPVVPAHDPVMAEAIRSVYATLDHLGIDERTAFVLRFIEGRELSEAAALCGCSLATFKRRVQRARARFDTLSRRDPVLCRWFDERRLP